jgi:hypothetical protein
MSDRIAQEVDRFMREELKLRTPQEMDEIRLLLMATFRAEESVEGEHELRLTLNDGYWPDRFRYTGRLFYGHLSADSGEVLLD